MGRIVEILPAPAVACLRPGLVVAMSNAAYALEMLKNCSQLSITSRKSIRSSLSGSRHRLRLHRDLRARPVREEGTQAGS